MALLGLCLETFFQCTKSRVLHASVMPGEATLDNYPERVAVRHPSPFCAIFFPTPWPRWQKQAKLVYMNKMTDVDIKGVYMTKEIFLVLASVYFSPRSFNVYGLWAVWPLLKSRIPGKIDMVRLRSKYFCVRTQHSYKSLGTVGKKRDVAGFFFGTSLKKNRWKCVGTRTPQSQFALLRETRRNARAWKLV